MLKNLEIWVTEKCNSRCLICHAWRAPKNNYEMSPERLKEILSRDIFKQIESVQISGGEPTMRSDLEELFFTVINVLPVLKSLTITTNGLKTEVIKSLFANLPDKEKLKFRLCVSLEGNREDNGKIRGVDSYNLVLETINAVRAVKPKTEIMILTTLTSINTNLESLDHVRKLSNKIGANHSFRIGYNSEPHHRMNNDNLAISDDQKKFITEYIKEYYCDNEFLLALREYILTGKIPVMAHCLAGNIFANLRADGKIYPCINSRREIGGSKIAVQSGIIKDLGKHELCPCCDEACFYPMKNYGKA